MSGRVEALALYGRGFPLARRVQDGLRRIGRILDDRRRERRRLAGRAMSPMRQHLLRDLGLVEADAHRLGLFG